MSALVVLLALQLKIEILALASFNMHKAEEAATSSASTSKTSMSYQQSSASHMSRRRDANRVQKCAGSRFPSDTKFPFMHKTDRFQQIPKVPEIKQRCWRTKRCYINVNVQRPNGSSHLLKINGEIRCGKKLTTS
jgi:hypothetical protein